jgi:Protein of unknown function (DUF3052)
MAGYSGTPLAKKLGIKPGHKIYLAGAPNEYLKWMSPLPGDVKFQGRMSGDTDLVHLFSTQKSKLEKSLRASLAKLKPDGMIWVSWPKQASKVPTDITEDTIRAVALPLGLVDIKVCAVNEVWSGLKLVIRKENRGK